MSIRPLGDSPADRPGREYQDRLNGSGKQPRPLPETARQTQPAGNLFKELRVTSIACPIELMGIIQSGEFLYFRAKHSKVELEISAQREAEPHAHYVKTLEIVNNEMGTGVLPRAICVAYIKRWLADYQQRCGGSGKPYTGESYLVNEPSESISI